MCLADFGAPTTTMPAKTKRTLNAQNDADTINEASPAKRVRIETSSNGLNGDFLVTEEPVELDDVEEENVEVVPAPVVDDLYLDTVYPLWFN